MLEGPTSEENGCMRCMERNTDQGRFPCQGALLAVQCVYLCNKASCASAAGPMSLGQELKRHPSKHFASSGNV